MDNGPPVTPVGLEVRLLGEGSVTFDGRPADALSVPRVLRLFARVAIAPSGAVDRAKLAFDLWPDSTDAQARTNLRKLLHDARSALPALDDVMQLDRGVLRWREGAPAYVDVIAMRAALDAGDADTVVTLYRGDLLPGCYDDWLLRERDVLRIATCDLLDAAATAALEADDAPGALRYARALVAIDPLREAGHRACMRASSALGDRTDAVRAYHRCVEVLEQQLGVAPEAETVALYEQIRDARGRAPTVTIAPLSSRTTTATLVGRADELATARALWDRCAAGEPALLAVTGEPGIGKTRLVAELERAIAADGAATARTRAYETTAVMPWGPVVDWLRSSALQARVSRLDDVWRRQIARLVPELRSPDGDDLAPADAGTTGRRILLDALVHALTSAGTPLLLVLDDLQWCDDDTLELLGYLVPAARDAPLMIACTVRDEEVVARPALRALLTGLVREGRGTEIRLGRLSFDDTLRVASEVSGRAIGSATARRVWAETEGSPLFAVELARADSFDDDRRALPPTIHAVITARLARLSTRARDLAEVAATMGREFEPTLLARASGASDDDLVSGLDELWLRQIIREHRQGYDFTHDKLREVLYGTISPARRRRLHRAVADAIAAEHERDLAPVSATLAAHYRAAGLPDRAVAAYRRAAEYDVEISALDDAIECLDRALELLADLAPGRDRDELEVELCVARGTSLSVRTGYGSDRTMAAYERGAAVCRRSRGVVDPAILRGLALAVISRCDFARSAALGYETLAASPADPVALVEGHYVVGVSEFWRANFAASREHLEAAVAAYRDDASREHIRRFAQDPLAVCLCRLALTRLWQGDRDESVALVARAVEYAERLDHPPTLAYVVLFAAIGAIERGELDVAADLVAKSDEIFGRYGEFAYFLSLDRLLRAWVELERGDGTGLRAIQRAVDGWRNATQSLHFTYGLTLLARAYARYGRPEAGRAVVHEALAWGVRHDQHYADAALLVVDADLLVASGDDRSARDTLTSALERATSQGAAWFARQARDRLATLPKRSPTGA